jgi:hypothetical protein
VADEKNRSVLGIEGGRSPPELEGNRVGVENLRLHCSYTTQRWLDAFEAHADQIRAMYDEPLVRLFRIYLSHGVALMRHGTNELYQIIITPGIDNERPLTRDWMYADEGSHWAGRQLSLPWSEEMPCRTPFAGRQSEASQCGCGRLGVYGDAAPLLPTAGRRYYVGSGPGRR